MRLRYFVLVSAALLIPTLAGASTGFRATLQPCQEVVTGANPNPCGVSTASGSGVFVLNGAQTELSYNITFSGLSSTQSAAHFHNAAAGVNGNVVRGFSPFTSPIIGIWKNTDGQALTPALVTQLLNGNIYANVHTQNYAAGEIRGQLFMDPTPVSVHTWGRIKSLYR